MDRIIAVWKPRGPTSHDVIDEIRRLTGEKTVGHAGTLDPLAAGVLVVGIGRKATKKLGETVKKEKEYVATIRLGAESTTDDEEGEKTVTSYQLPVTSEQINDSIRKFIGRIKQTPPRYSAIKIRGQEAYKRIRRGETVELKPRIAEIKSIEILKYKWPYLKLQVVTGPGVYIRSLARDIGNDLKVGGYLSDLERTRVGKYTKEKAASLEDFNLLYSKNND